MSFNAELLVFVVYLVFMVGIGVYFFLKSKDGGEKGYFLGGRQMGPWVSALSAGASDMSAWVLMGLPASIYALGMGQTWIAIGLGIGYAASWIFEAPRLRRFSIEANDSITIPQYLTNRFLSSSRALQIICAVIFLVAYTIYAASSIKACGTLFNTVIGIDATVAMYVAAVIIICYTFLGGFSAVCWTDFFQGLLMLVALLAVPIVAATTMNLDKAALTEVYTYVDGGVTKEAAFGASVFGASWQEIVTGLSWGLGYFGMPHILVRFMSIEKPSKIKKSAIVAIIWVLITLVAAILIAYIGRMAVGKELIQDAGNQKLVFIALARKLFEDKNWIFEDSESVLDAIKNHSSGFETNNLISLSIILADKLDIKKTRISEEGKKIEGNRQYAHIEDIIVNIQDDVLTINFITDGKIIMKEINNYYFTDKIFKAIEAFSKKTNLKYYILMDNKPWKL